MFRTCPNWNKVGDPVDGVWKQDLLIYLGQLFNLRLLVETGTCEGSTPAAVHHAFDEIHTVELSDYFYDFSKRRLEAQGVKNTFLYKGNSAEGIKTILEKIPNVPTLFWLDAHPCGGFSADEGDPLEAELLVVEKMRPDGLIVIDDQHSDALYPTTPMVGWVRDFRCGELILHKGGYSIPPFEG